MDPLDLDVFDDYNCSQDGSSSYPLQEGVSTANYYDNSITYCDPGQFVANYNPNFVPVDSTSFQNQNLGLAPMNSSSSNLPSVYYGNNNNLNYGFNNPGYLVCPNGALTEWQPPMQVQGEFSQVDSGSYGSFQNTQGEFSNVVSSYEGIVSDSSTPSVQFQHQVALPPVHYADVVNSASTSTSTGNSVEEISAHTGAPPPSSSVASSDELQKKLDQKRERNRIAARKCRDKKFSKIKTLQSDIKNLDKENRRHQEEIDNLVKRRNQLRLMLSNLSFSQLSVNPDILTKT